MANIRLELLNKDTLALSFPYDRSHVAAVKRLASRRWNPRHSRWEVHLTHLAEVMRLFNLSASDLPDGLQSCLEACPAPRTAQVELGVLRGRLTGSDLPVAEIDEATSYFVPGYRYSQRHRSGQWDGRKHLFSRRTLTFPAGLWPRIEKILKNSGIMVTVAGTDRAVRRRSAAAATATTQASATSLRDYQRKALMQAMHARRGVIQIPTGGGKTLLAAHLIHAIGAECFFFVHTRDLLHQTVAVFERELGTEIGVVGDGRAQLRPVTVATIQTAVRAIEGTPARRTTRGRSAADDDEGPDEAAVELDEATRLEIVEAIQRAGLVIFDECHHVPADSFYQVAMKTRSAGWRFGLSATPWRDDEQDLLLEAAIGPAVSRTNFSDLIEAGYLVPPSIHVLRPRMPRIANARRMAYGDLYGTAIVENHDRNRAIAAQARAWAQDGLSVLVLVAQTQHGERLLELMPEAVFVHGGVDSAVRREMLDHLERKLHPIMIATTLADEGLDVPTLDAVILAGGGKSATRLYQRIGRALRPAPGKRCARVLDFMDDLPYFRQHSEARLALYRQEPCFELSIADASPPAAGA